MKANRKAWCSPRAIGFIIFSVILAGIAPIAAADPLPAIPQPTLAKHGMVVAQEPQAARIGLDVLRRGGNAVDAAVATGFAMAVTYPRAGNIGGGGFMVIHLATGRRDIAIDYRETAPAATTQDVFLDDKTCDRRTGHGRGPCARPSQIWLGPADACATARAGHCAFTQRIRSGRRRRRYTRRRAAAAHALAVIEENLVVQLLGRWIITLYRIVDENFHAG